MSRLKELYRDAVTGKTPPAPLMIDVYSLLRMYGAEGHYRQVYNRITREVVDMPEAHDEVGFSKADMDRLQLTDTGVFLFSEVLAGYIGQPAVIATWKNLRELNKLRLTGHGLSRSLRGMDVCQVEGFIQTLEQAGPDEVLTGIINQAKKVLRWKRITRMFSMKPEARLRD